MFLSKHAKYMYLHIFNTDHVYDHEFHELI